MGRVVAAGKARLRLWMATVSQSQGGFHGTLRCPRRQQHPSSEIRSAPRSQGGWLTRKRHRAALCIRDKPSLALPEPRQKADAQFSPRASARLPDSRGLRGPLQGEPFCYAECIAELHRAAVLLQPSSFSTAPALSLRAVRKGKDPYVILTYSIESRRC